MKKEAPAPKVHTFKLKENMHLSTWTKKKPSEGKFGPEAFNPKDNVAEVKHSGGGIAL